MKSALIAERDEYTSNKTAEYLQVLVPSDEFKINQVQNAQLGLLSVQRGRTDLVLLSDSLDGIESREFVRRIRSMEGGRETAVILIRNPDTRERTSSQSREIDKTLPVLHRPVSLDQLRSLLTETYKLVKPSDRLLKSEVFIRDDIIMVELSGYLTAAELVSLKYKILDMTRSHKSSQKRFFIIIYSLEKEGLTQERFEHIFDFYSAIGEPPAEQIKILTSDPAVRSLLKSSRVPFETVDNYVHGLQQLKSLFFKDGKEAVRVDFLRPEVILYKDVFDSKGRLVKRKGSSFTGKELEILKRKRVDRLYYSRTARVDTGRQIMAGENVDVVMDAINVTGVLIPEDIKNIEGMDESKKRLVRNLLIVNSDPAERSSLERFFSAQGFPVRSAANLAEARKLLGQFPFHHCVIDLELEDGRGLDLVKSVVDSGTACGFTITGKKVLPEMVKEAIRLGVKGFLKSPIDLNRLDEVFSRPHQST